MNYHNIEHCNMINGDGIRTVLFVSGCNHHCKNCQNPQTWDCNSGILFDTKAKLEIIDSLKNDYISGITLSGGDPLYPANREEISKLVSEIKYIYPNKNIWMYTGYIWEDIVEDQFIKNKILPYIDVIIDGEFKEELKDIDLKWVGSSNQRIINVKKSLANFDRPYLYQENKKSIINSNMKRKSF